MKSPPTSSAGEGVVVEVLGRMRWVATHCNGGGGGALSAVRLVGLVVELAITGASSMVLVVVGCGGGLSLVLVMVVVWWW